jgi:hypothetical protein
MDEKLPSETATINIDTTAELANRYTSASQPSTYIYATSTLTCAREDTHSTPSSITRQLH